MAYPLVYTLVPAANPNEKEVLLIFHGYGANENDLLDIPKLLKFRGPVVSFQGPISVGQHQFAWFNLEVIDQEVSYDLSETEESIDLVELAIQQIKEVIGFEPESILLFGFSQGGGIALATALTRNLPIRKVAACSMLWPDGFEDEILPQQKKAMKVFMTHGLSDPLIPIGEAKMNEEMLLSHQINLKFQSFSMGHELNNESIFAIRDFFDLDA